ncbi:DUF4148 domain-containing protein [Paucibacter sp. KBW04]|uniref:DUF4148 domain-containing protein n=1 Tax=Paucibacter sp. KBW04 TaxID=2153361 RepID=UPI0018CC7A0C|nr:DUF4148 domain-containing protein [Paucibacter sp. KBW04]
MQANRQSLSFVSFKPLAAVALSLGLWGALAAPALAADAVQATAERTRAEVIADLVKARAEGMLQAENEVDPFTTQRRAEAKQREEIRLAALNNAQAKAGGKSPSPQ